MSPRLGNTFIYNHGLKRFKMASFGKPHYENTLSLHISLTGKWYLFCQIKLWKTLKCTPHPPPNLPCQKDKNECSLCLTGLPLPFIIIELFYSSVSWIKLIVMQIILIHRNTNRLYLIEFKWSSPLALTCFASICKYISAFVLFAYVCVVI